MGCEMERTKPLFPDAQEAEHYLWKAKNALTRLQHKVSEDEVRVIGVQIHAADLFRQWMEEHYGTK